MTVEAAMVYPLVILMVLGLICVSMELYQQACFSGSIHQSLEEEGGRETGTVETVSPRSAWSGTGSYECRSSIGLWDETSLIRTCRLMGEGVAAVGGAGP